MKNPTVLELARYALWIFNIAEKYNISFEKAQKKLDDVIKENIN